MLVLRDRVEIHFNIRGLSVAKLIAACHQKSARLDEDDQDRIEELKAEGRSYVCGNEMGWFKRICKQVGEIERYM